MTEEWRPVDGFPNYFVSSCGRVRGPVRVLKPAIDADGYHRVTLRRELRSFRRGVHSLVVAAWCGARPSPQHTAAHFDGSKTNNVPSNLRWATHEEQYHDRRRHGTDNAGTRNAAAKLDYNKAAVIRDRYVFGSERHGIQALAVEFGVSRCAVHRIVRGVGWLAA